MRDGRDRKARIRAAADRFRDSGASEHGGFRVVVTGKGGAGKTTLTAFFCRCAADDGMQVLAVDEDPQENLAFSLGLPPGRAAAIVPLAENAAYIQEKTGVPPASGWGGMIVLNPDVRDVVDRFGVRVDERLSLLVMGSVEQAATGCLCPENALLNGVIRYIHLREGEAIFLDTQAGVEHFGRALAEGFSQAVVVTEPTFNGVRVALHAAALARQSGIPHIHLVINKARAPSDEGKALRLIGPDHTFSTISIIPLDEAVLDCEPDVTPLIDADTPYARHARAVYEIVRRYGAEQETSAAD
jgi:CO dehydrogenase maturation factor